MVEAGLGATINEAIRNVKANLPRDCPAWANEIKKLKHNIKPRYGACTELSPHKKMCIPSGLTSRTSRLRQ